MIEIGVVAAPQLATQSIEAVAIPAIMRPSAALPRAHPAVMTREQTEPGYRQRLTVGLGLKRRLDRCQAELLHAKRIEAEARRNLQLTQYRLAERLWALSGENLRLEGLIQTAQQTLSNLQGVLRGCLDYNIERRFYK